MGVARWPAASAPLLAMVWPSSRREVTESRAPSGPEAHVGEFEALLILRKPPADPPEGMDNRYGPRVGFCVTSQSDGAPGGCGIFLQAAPSLTRQNSLRTSVIGA